jgi:hypothetical protein
MIITGAPQNEAVLSNVGEIGEFRIRNSAKAFNILSSGLYANKVRAIIRELSCNAVDSHTAAGRTGTPFDVHLPTQLEPWFAIRDYGTGLSHDQVTNIYTTYFESSKTDSNDFIGALGLGSKSPFSYTDNFTVTAIKDGVKGIYSAFINAEGVPSIVKMGSEESTEPTGVEVKFSVNDRWDFSKFHDEARQVYTYFKLRPVVSGASDFAFKDRAYETENIIPGVHSYSDSGRNCIAVMGNIAYPVQVPEAAQKDLGDIAGLLNCGLELHFAIGELDFQASREGLSYIPQTINSIKRKLEAVNAQLAIHIATEADAIKNLWERTFYLLKKKESALWQAAVKKYVVDTKFDLIDATSSSYYYIKAKEFELPVMELAKKYNIEILAFQKNVGSKGTSNLNSYTVHPKNSTDTAYKAWQIRVSEGANFIKNDTKIGALARAKFHFNNTQFPKGTYHYQIAYVLSKADKNKPAKFDAFLKALSSPPTVMNASDLMLKERASSSVGGKNVTIMRMEERGRGSYYAQKEMVWRDAGKADTFDTKETYYYLPLSGFNILSDFGLSNTKEFAEDLKRSGFDTLNVEIYGVRKGDIDFIKTQKNWINIEAHLKTTLSSVKEADLKRLVMSTVDKKAILQYHNTIADNVENKSSPYLQVASMFKNVSKIDGFSQASLQRLCRRYATELELTKLETTIENDCAAVLTRYPLLSGLETYRMNNLAIAEYINLIDAKKGV